MPQARRTKIESITTRSRIVCFFYVLNSRGTLSCTGRRVRCRDYQLRLCVFFLLCPNAFSYDHEEFKTSMFVLIRYKILVDLNPLPPQWHLV